ncbi:MAG: HD domain-containing protein [bacterium]|jgi:phosphonate degradation associated HDIG domain protein
MVEQLKELLEPFEQNGNLHYGEGVTELAHALQAACLAHEAGEKESMIAAALLHDYGHLVHGLGESIAEQGVDANHETVGANALEKWFPTSVTEPIRWHVAAKRYLCATELGYFDQLSPASVLSLQLQGGPMNPEELEKFSARPFSEEAVRLRRYDDQAKNPSANPPGLATYYPVLKGLLVK